MVTQGADTRQDAEYGGGPYAVRGDVLDLTWDDDGSTMSFRFVRDADGNLTLTSEPGAKVDDTFVMTTTRGNASASRGEH